MILRYGIVTPHVLGEQKDAGAHYLVGLDNDKNYIYKRQATGSHFDYACAFDLLFR